MSKTEKVAQLPHAKDVEAIVHAEGTGGRIIVLRIKPGYDMVDGIKQACRYYGLKAGVITSIFGSLERVRLMVGSKGLRFPVPPGHKGRTIETGEANVASGCGLVNTLEDGEITMHLHIVVFPTEGPMAGGHVDCDTPTPVFGTLELAIQEVKGVKLVRKVDEDVGLPVTFPVQE